MNYFRWIFVVALTCSFVACDSTAEENANPDTIIVDTGPRIEDQITLTINFAQGKENIVHRIHHASDLTVLDVLLKAGEANGFMVGYSGSGETAFVESIDGIFGGEGDDLWWIFRVNQKIANKGSGLYRLEPGDKVEWQLGNYE